MCSSAVTSVRASSRILPRITLERIQVKTETEIGDEQVGFRQGRGQEIKSICTLWTSRRRSTLSLAISSG